MTTRAAKGDLSQDELWWIIDRLPTGLVVIDRDLNVLYKNPAAQRLAHPVPLRRGAPLPDLDTEPTLRELAERLLLRSVLIEHEVAAPAGRAFLVDGIAHAGSEIAVLRIDDVTARARREQAEHDFAVNAAHEFLSPLTAIAGAVYVLQDERTDDPAVRRRFVRHIANGADRLLSSARALLALARAEAGVEPPRLELVPLRALLDEVAAERPEGLVRIRCPDDAAVLVDRDLLYQALANLVENARRHSTQPIDIVVDDTGERALVIEVVDTGSGILPEHLERVTERFFTGSGRDSGGYGIGISIVARSVEVLGGRLTIESGRGGTCVRIELPSARLVAA